MQISHLYYKITASSLYLSMQGPYYNMDSVLFILKARNYDMISQMNITEYTTEGGGQYLYNLLEISYRYMPSVFI